MTAIFYFAFLFNQYNLLRDKDNIIHSIVIVVGIIFISIFFFLKFRIPGKTAQSIRRVALSIYAIIILPSIAVIPIHLSQTTTLPPEKTLNLIVFSVITINFFSVLYSIPFTVIGNPISVYSIIKLASSKLISARRERGESNFPLMSYDKIIFMTIEELAPIIANRSRERVESIKYLIDRKIIAINKQAQLVTPLMSAISLLGLIAAFIPYISFPYLENISPSSSVVDLDYVLLLTGVLIIVLIAYFVRYFIHAYWSTIVLEIASILCYLRLHENE